MLFIFVPCPCFVSLFLSLLYDFKLCVDIQLLLRQTVVNTRLSLPSPLRSPFACEAGARRYLVLNFTVFHLNYCVIYIATEY